MALQSLVRWLMPREDHFYDFLEKQAAFTHSAAVALQRLGEPSAVPDTVARAVQTIEHEADAVVRDMEDALAKTFVTPIDREDLQRLSAGLDDIVDLTNLAARAYVLYAVGQTSAPMKKLMALLVETTALIAAAVPRLRRHAYAELLDECRKIRALEKEADTVFRAAVSALFHDGEIDAKVLLREKEFLEDLEGAVDKCDDASDVLANLSVKHG